MLLNAADALKVGSMAVDAVYVGTAQVWPPASSSVAATLTIASGEVASNLTAFPTRVDLSHMPAGWWDDVATDGGNVRVKQGATDIPFDLVSIDKTSQTGELFFKADLLAASDNVFTLDKSGSSALAVTDPNGRNAVWADYDTVYFFHGGDVDRTGGATTLSRVGVTARYRTWNEQAQLFSATQISGSITADQGLCLDDVGNFYLVDDDHLIKVAASSPYGVLATNSNPIADSGITVSPEGPTSDPVNHLGGAEYHDGELYIVLQRWENTTYNNQWVAVYDADDLSYVRSYDLSANGHETSGIARDPDAGKWYISEYVGGKIHRYSSSFAYEGVVATGLPNVQDLAWLEGWLYAACNALARVNPATGAITTASGATYNFIEDTTATEAVTVHDGELYWINAGGIHKPLRQPVSASYPDEWLAFPTRAGHATITGLPAVRSTWTAGISGVPTGASGSNRTALTYGDVTGADGNRASMLARSSNNYEIWNSGNSWMGSGQAATLDVRRRLHMIYATSGTTTRRIYIDGTLRASGATAQRPLGATPTLWLGGGAGSSERWQGSLGYVYLRDGELSADWLAAEVASWETPASFYAVT